MGELGQWPRPLHKAARWWTDGQRDAALLQLSPQMPVGASLACCATNTAQHNLPACRLQQHLSLRCPSWTTSVPARVPAESLDTEQHAEQRPADAAAWGVAGARQQRLPPLHHRGQGSRRKHALPQPHNATGLLAMDPRAVLSPNPRTPLARGKNPTPPQARSGKQHSFPVPPWAHAPSRCSPACGALCTAVPQARHGSPCWQASCPPGAGICGVPASGLWVASGSRFVGLGRPSRM